MWSKRVNNEDWRIQRTWTRGSPRTFAVTASTAKLVSWSRAEKKAIGHVLRGRDQVRVADSVEISLLSECGPVAVAVGPVAVVAGG